MKELMRDLVPFVDSVLNGEGGCPHVHFTIVVWCNCCERPSYIGGNDDNTPRALKMLKLASDAILDAEVMEGHA